MEKFNKNAGVSPQEIMLMKKIIMNGGGGSIGELEERVETLEGSVEDLEDGVDVLNESVAAIEDELAGRLSERIEFTNVVKEMNQTDTVIWDEDHSVKMERFEKGYYIVEAPNADYICFATDNGYDITWKEMEVGSINLTTEPLIVDINNGSVTVYGYNTGGVMVVVAQTCLYKAGGVAWGGEFDYGKDLYISFMTTNSGVTDPTYYISKAVYYSYQE